MFRAVKLLETESRKVVARGWGQMWAQVGEGPILIPVPSVISSTGEAGSGREVTQKDGFLGLTMLIHNNMVYYH